MNTEKIRITDATATPSTCAMLTASIRGGTTMNHQPYGQNHQPNHQYPPQPYAQGPRTVVTKRGANHGLHLFLSFITLGLWAITGWPIAAMLGRKTKTRAY